MRPRRGTVRNQSRSPALLAASVCGADRAQNFCHQGPTPRPFIHIAAQSTPPPPLPMSVNMAQSLLGSRERERGLHSIVEQFLVNPAWLTTYMTYEYLVKLHPFTFTNAYRTVSTHREKPTDFQIQQTSTPWPCPPEFNSKKRPSSSSLVCAYLKRGRPSLKKHPPHQKGWFSPISRDDQKKKKGILQSGSHPWPHTQEPTVAGSPQSVRRNSTSAVSIEAEKAANSSVAVVPGAAR